PSTTRSNATQSNNNFISCAATTFSSELNNGPIKSGASFPACVLIWIASQRLAPLFFVCELLAFFEVEFAGGEDGDGFDALDALWNPQIWNAGIAKFVAQLRKIDIYRAEQH